MKIIDTRTRDTKLFHKLGNKQRNKGLNFVEDFHVGDNHYAGRDQILHGFKQHFETLAKQKDNEIFDKHYHELVINEVQSFQILVADKEIGEVTIEELGSAIKCINQGKSPDYY